MYLTLSTWLLGPRLSPLSIRLTPPCRVLLRSTLGALNIVYAHATDGLTKLVQNLPDRLQRKSMALELVPLARGNRLDPTCLNPEGFLDRGILIPRQLRSRMVVFTCVSLSGDGPWTHDVSLMSPCSRGHGLVMLSFLTLKQFRTHVWVKLTLPRPSVNRQTVPGSAIWIRRLVLLGLNADLLKVLTYIGVLLPRIVRVTLSINTAPLSFTPCSPL